MLYMYDRLLSTQSQLSHVIGSKCWIRFEKLLSPFPCYFFVFYKIGHQIRQIHLLALFIIFKNIDLTEFFSLLVAGIYCTREYLDFFSHHQNKILVKIVRLFQVHAVPSNFQGFVFTYLISFFFSLLKYSNSYTLLEFGISFIPDGLYPSITTLHSLSPFPYRFLFCRLYSLFLFCSLD